MARETFNSLSRDHEKALRPTAKLIDENTFNSLSRDHTGPSTAEQSPSIPYFQLPLSGSHHNSSDRGARERRGRSLSTPSLGITEPDSGIFRLSAASCRGAPSHK